jgi:hypothetical protein
MKYACLMLGMAICACVDLNSLQARAESAVVICMWPDGRPTRVGINYDARTVTWANNSAPAKVTDQEVSWEIPGETNFSLNRHSLKIRITGWGGLRNSTSSYACTATAP